MTLGCEFLQVGINLSEESHGLMGQINNTKKKKKIIYHRNNRTRSLYTMIVVTDQNYLNSLHP